MRPRAGVQLADLRATLNYVTQLIDTFWDSPKKVSKLLNYRIIKKEKEKADFIMISKKETIEYYFFHGKKNVKVQVFK